MLPAYAANPAAQLTGGGMPIDFGKKWRDGQRILGEGKTWSGLVGGLVGGVFVGGIQIAIAAAVDNPALVPTFDPSLGPASPASFLVVFTLALGALLGDAGKSFVKRRLRRARGANLPIVDQYDFVVGAWFLGLLLFPVWFVVNFQVEVIIVVILITFFLHRAVSVLGYRMGLKAEPW
jgi:CDP-2,3-bis-(O-geranylgeranyl)-sn-glycerol synthase